MVSNAAPTLEYRLLRALFGLFLFSEVLSGVARYVLESVGQVEIFYLPKLLLIAGCVLIPILSGRLPIGFLLLIVSIAGYLVLGMLQLNSLLQAIFGLWILTPFLFGLLSGKTLFLRADRLRALILSLFWITWIGVLVTSFWDYPWRGAGYQLGAFAVEASREWWAGDFSRPAGFSRASFSAANQLLVFGIFLLFFLRSDAGKICVWIAAGIGIVLTTSKGSLLAWFLISLYAISRPFGFRRFWNCVIVILGISISLLPLSTVFIRYNINFSNPASEFLFASGGERLTWMWPASFDLFQNAGQWITGLGLGGIGTPQLYFQTLQFVSADNIFVYLIVTFGLPVTIIFFTLLIWKGIRSNGVANTKHGHLIFAMLLAILSRGGVSNVIESSELSLFLGLVTFSSIHLLPEWQVWLRGANVQKMSARQ